MAPLVDRMKALRAELEALEQELCCPAPAPRRVDRGLARAAREVVAKGVDVHPRELAALTGTRVPSARVALRRARGRDDHRPPGRPRPEPTVLERLLARLAGLELRLAMLERASRFT